MKKIVSILLAVFLVFTLSSCKNSKKGEFKYWNDSAALTALKDYVSDVTNKKSDNFIPVEDRIAVFDMDGTLCGELFPTYLEYLLCAYRCLEDKNYEATEEMKENARLMIDGAKTSYPSNMALIHAYTQAKAFEGMTINEFEEYVKFFLDRPADGFKNLKYSDSFYLPMIEVVSYLEANDFIVYIVSGSDRYICRAFACERLNIAREHVIGMDVRMIASGQPEGDAVDYQFKAEDKVIRSDELLIKNLKMNKVAQIAQEIGRQPVLSFGNSSGDSSMHLYTITNNKYRSAACMLIADDEARDYGNTEKALSLKEKWIESGFYVISMKDDFKTIYGYDVEKTSLTYIFN